MVITCGVFIFDSNNKLLICHPTGQPNYGGLWSIPKGLVDKDETHRIAACREVMEETGLEIDPKDLIEVGLSKYPNGKKSLSAFVVKLKKTNDKLNLLCTSYVELLGHKPFPEVDCYEWVDIDMAFIMLHPVLVKFLLTVQRIIHLN